MPSEEKNPKILFALTREKQRKQKNTRAAQKTTPKTKKNTSKPKSANGVGGGGLVTCVLLGVAVVGWSGWGRFVACVLFGVVVVVVSQFRVTSVFLQ